MRFDVLTIFPDMIESVLGDSIIGRARSSGIIDVGITNIRDYSKNKHKKTDEYPYSGGGGMVMTPQPIYDAYRSIADKCEEKPHTIFMSPEGERFTQKTAKRLAQYEHIVILCGHYEGVDQRVLDLVCDEEISMGDFVLTGGEIPAMAVIDAVSRLIPGVLANEGSYTNESHYNSLLEHPQYTRPAEFMGMNVPEVLLSGNHAEIEKWKRKQSVLQTAKKRPDLLREAKLSDDEKQMLLEKGIKL